MYTDVPRRRRRRRRRVYARCENVFGSGTCQPNVNLSGTSPNDYVHDLHRHARRHCNHVSEPPPFYLPRPVRETVDAAGDARKNYGLCFRESRERIPTRMIPPRRRIVCQCARKVARSTSEYRGARRAPEFPVSSRIYEYFANSNVGINLRGSR